MSFSYNDVFRRLCGFYMKDGLRVLHLGAGGDALGLAGVRSRRGLFVSLDMDCRQLEKNPNGRKIVADANNLPFKDGSFGLILSDAFFEHVKNPGAVLCECFRVSRDNSRLVFNTPNRFSYISAFNMYAPRPIKDAAKRLSGPEREYFPAYYRYNTRRQIHSVSSAAGYKVDIVKSYAGLPSYFDFSAALRIFFMFIHYIIESVKFLSDRFGMTFIGVLHKA